MAESPASADFTDDRLLDGRVILRQAVNGYRAAVDPVLLAAAVRVRGQPRILDAGCGSGAAGFCLAARCAGVTIVGLEVQAQPAAWMQDGIALNGFAGRVGVAYGDLAAPPDLGGPFDVVMTNPPFGAEGTPPPDAALAVAHMETGITLAGWIKACLAQLKPQGRLVMIHRADRLSEILAALRGPEGHGPAGDLHILPIFPKAGAAARRVIVDAGKGRRSPDTLLPGLVLHHDDGGFTAAADAVLRKGEGLFPA
jgi:tRNA1(Val) A37 N6-methylase TrmN6